MDKFNSETAKILKRLVEFEEEWNKKDKLRSCKVCHHRIVMNNGVVFSLEQLILYLQMGDNEIVSVDQSIKPSDFK